MICCRVDRAIRDTHWFTQYEPFTIIGMKNDIKLLITIDVLQIYPQVPKNGDLYHNMNIDLT